MRILKFLMEAAGGAAAGGTGGGGTTAPPGGTTTPAATGAAAGGSATTVAAPAEWTTGFNDDMKGYITNKGFKDPGTLVESYRNLEKLVGVPKERLLKLPENLEDAAQMGEIYTRLGRPEKPEGYGFKGENDFGKMASGKLFELGISRKQGEELGKWWDGYIAETNKAQDAKLVADNTAQAEALKKNWGPNYDQNLKVAKGAAQEFGVPSDVIDKMESTMGFSKVMEFFHKIGTKIGEGNFVPSNNNSGAVTTVESAKQRISALKTDTEFATRLSKGDVAAKTEWEKLHRLAYPDQPAN